MSDQDSATNSLSQRGVWFDVLLVLVVTFWAFEIRQWRLGIPASPYFDEVYYVKAAKCYLEHQLDSNTVHPPLGKILTAVGMYVYNKVAEPLWKMGLLDTYSECAGWRLCSLISGVLMIPLTYMLGLRMYGSRFVAGVAIYLMSVDFLHVAQCRIAMLDMPLALLILMASYTAWRYIENPERGSTAWLIATPVLLGVGAACKWNSIFAAVGIYFAMICLRPMPPKARLDAWARRAVTVGLWFALLMPVMYSLSFLPLFFENGSVSVSLQQIKDNHLLMWNFRHDPKQFTHRYMSQFWEWPTMIRPIWYFYEEHPDPTYSVFPPNKDHLLGQLGWRSKPVGPYVYGVIAMGSPFVWWTFLVFFFLTFIQCVILPISSRFTAISTDMPEAAFNRLSMSARMKEWLFGENRPWMFLLLLYLPQVLLWSINSGFFFYMLPCVPFMCILIAAILHEWRDLPGGLACIAVYMITALLFFVAYYPLICDYPVPKAVYELLIYVQRWI